MAENTLFKEYNSADYVKFAEQTASWIKTTGSLGKYGRLWNQSPDSKEDFTDYPMLTPKSLYGGSAGVGLFYLRLYQATKKTEYLEETKSAAKEIIESDEGAAFYERTLNAKASGSKLVHVKNMPGWAAGYYNGPTGSAYLVLKLYELTGDELYKIIANKELIALNQDALGLQAKRIFTTAKKVCGGGQMSQPDKDYITDCDRVDVLAKPLSDGSLALCFLNLSQEKKTGEFAVGLELIKKYLDEKLPDDFYEAKSFEMTNLWSGEKNDVSFDKLSDVVFAVRELDACGNATFKVVAK